MGNNNELKTEILALSPFIPFWLLLLPDLKKKKTRQEFKSYKIEARCFARGSKQPENTAHGGGGKDLSWTFRPLRPSRDGAGFIFLTSDMLSEFCATFTKIFEETCVDKKNDRDHLRNFEFISTSRNFGWETSSLETKTLFPISNLETKNLFPWSKVWVSRF